jgi:hypothetical protein
MVLEFKTPQQHLFINTRQTHIHRLLMSSFSPSV